MALHTTSPAVPTRTVRIDFLFCFCSGTNDKIWPASACGAISNETTATVINPVMSARINTKRSHHIQFGKVEVRAKIPRGDWLWPSIWMLPVNEDKYGPWPRSGEIDILSARGNGVDYRGQLAISSRSLCIGY